VRLPDVEQHGGASLKSLVPGRPESKSWFQKEGSPP
jgi:hypothetical protein